MNIIIADNMDVVQDIHQYLLKFRRDTGVPGRLLKLRLEFRL